MVCPECVRNVMFLHALIGAAMLIMYKVVFGSLWPCMTICLVNLSLIVTLFSSKIAIQLLSQSVPIDMRDFPGLEICVLGVPCLEGCVGGVVQGGMM